MSKAIAKESLDSWDYCINFWEGALDDDEDARQEVKQLNGPRHVRAFDDVA